MYRRRICEKTWKRRDGNLMDGIVHTTDPSSFGAADDALRQSNVTL
jgi:hypothetical protein